MRRIISVIALLGFCLLVVPAWALDPAKSPGQNFDLSHWYLQLPTSGGVLTGTGGSVDSFSTSQLVAGATNAYFYTGPDGAMTFMVPDNGATTSGSTHPRSELREELVANSTSLNWTMYGTHIMTATCVVSNVPSDTQKVCIGQIHESGGIANNEHMIMFDLGNRRIYANVSSDGNLASTTFSQTFVSGSGVALGTPIKYTMSVVEGVLTISVNNVTNSWGLFSGTNYNGHVFTNWDRASGNTVYFKAGDYNQTDNTCACSNDFAKVAFYSLTRYHSACLTNLAYSTNVMIGSNVTFNAGADGNGSLSYQWQFNGTNLSGKTSSSLVITNLSTNNTGNYSVVVGDNTSSFSTMTGLVAVLTVTLTPPVNGTTPVFSGLSSPTITYGTPSVSLSGTLKGTNGVTTVYPAFGDTVSATINGFIVSGAVNSTSGRFFIPYYDASLATDGVGGSPYAITYSYAGKGTTLNAATNSTSAVLTVNPAELTLSGIIASNKLYDATLTAGINTDSAALVGNLDGGNVVLSAVGATGTFTPDGNVGSNKTVQVTGLTVSGSATNNYTLTQPTATADITPAGLTVFGITANNKLYDGTATATLNTSGATLVGNLDGGNVVLSTNGTTGIFTPDGNVGSNKTVQVSGLTMSGLAINNYTLVQPTGIASISAPPGSVSSLSNKVVNINFFGIPGSNYVVQAATNLAGTWQPVSTNTAGGNSSWLFSDPNATNGQQFYRIVTP